MTERPDDAPVSVVDAAVVDPVAGAVAGAGAGAAAGAVAGPAPGGRLVAAVATLGAVVLVVGTVLSVRGVPTADLPTTLVAAAAGTVLQTASGSRPVTAGARVPDGATLITALGGAVLRTGARTVRLAPTTTVVVRDGARQHLRAGALLVDARDGDGLRVTGRSARASVPDGSVVRVEQPSDGVSTARVAAYRGTAVVGSAGRRATVEVGELRQVQVLPDAAPGRVRPLALTPGDAWEARELDAVVADDDLLSGMVSSFASALDDGGEVRPVVAAAPSPGAGASTLRRAERALAFALAHSGGVDYDEKRDGRLQAERADGGSWGVVVALVKASAGDAGRFVDARLGLPSGNVLAAAGPVDLMGLLPGAPGAPGAPGTDGTTGPGAGGVPTPPGRDGVPDAPSAPGDPAGPDRPGGSNLPPPLGPIVDDLLDLLPTPLPVPVLPGAGVDLGGVAVDVGRPGAPAVQIVVPPLAPVVDAVDPVVRDLLPGVDVPGVDVTDRDAPAGSVPAVSLPGVPVTGPSAPRADAPAPAAPLVELPAVPLAPKADLPVLR